MSTVTSIIPQDQHQTLTGAEMRRTHGARWHSPQTAQESTSTGGGDCAGPARGGDMAERSLLAHLQDEGEEPLEVGPGVGARGEEAARLGPRAQHRPSVVFRKQCL